MIIDIPFFKPRLKIQFRCPLCTTILVSCNTLREKEEIFLKPLKVIVNFGSSHYNHGIDYLVMWEHNSVTLIFFFISITIYKLIAAWSYDFLFHIAQGSA